MRVDEIGIVELDAQPPKVGPVEVEALGQRGDGHDDAVVHGDVRAAAAKSPVGQPPHDLDRQILDQDGAAHGRGVAEQLPGRLVADQGHLGPVGDVLRREVASLGQGPVPGFGIILGGPDHHRAFMIPVAGLQGDLTHGAHGQHGVGSGQGTGDGPGVVPGQGVEALAHRTVLDVAAEDHDGVRAEKIDNLQGLAPRPVHRGHDDGQGGDAHGHGGHDKAAAGLVGPKRQHGHVLDAPEHAPGAANPAPHGRHGRGSAGGHRRPWPGRG